MRISLFLIALALASLCHYFSSFELMASDHKELISENRYYDVFVTVREDDRFKYMDIVSSEGKDGEMMVEVTNGMVNIKRDVTRTKKVENENSSLLSSYESSFSRILSVPDGVDDRKAEITTKEDRVTIKFPKQKNLI